MTLGIPGEGSYHHRKRRCKPSVVRLTQSEENGSCVPCALHGLLKDVGALARHIRCLCILGQDVIEAKEGESASLTWLSVVSI